MGLLCIFPGMNLTLRPPDDSWNLDWQTIFAPLEELKACSICPRVCNADRSSPQLGYCQAGIGFAVDSVFPHRGEEPVLSGAQGICNLFFSHCNMQCAYCQNYQISENRIPVAQDLDDLISITKQIEATLATGVRLVGFVSPSHFVPQMKVIINTLKARGHDPVFVFNTNGYDQVETIRGLDGMIQVYLPDLKYMDNGLAAEYSDTNNYVEHATTAIREMFRQKGSSIRIDEEGVIESGMIIRHLVLPGKVENSIAVLRFIADELSPSVHVSLMSQYYPTQRVNAHPTLGRTVTKTEYDKVLSEFERLGFYRGWVQELSSPHHYRPDFLRDRPFEE
jgi:putative pyruvate formate lyase activating enzyme